MILSYVIYIVCVLCIQAKEPHKWSCEADQVCFQQVNFKISRKLNQAIKKISGQYTSSKNRLKPFSLKVIES